MKLGLALATLTALALATSAFAAINSGPRVGQQLTPFQVVDVSGPNKGKQLCYVCNYGIAPVVAAFVKDDPTKAASLVGDLQRLADASKRKGLKTFVVFTGGPELKESIEKIASANKITIPMTFLPQGASADDYTAYKISPQARNTVLVYRGLKVLGNFVDVNKASFAEVEKTAAAMLGH